MDSTNQLRNDLMRLRMVVAIDSAMLLSVLRRMRPEELAQASSGFLEVCEGLSIKTLFSELNDEAVQAAQKRRDWWVGLLAELLADGVLTPPQQSPIRQAPAV